MSAPTIETFTDFIESATKLDDWDKEIHPTVWGRHKTETQPTWEEVVSDGDPYDLTDAFAAIGVADEFEAMFVMYGRMQQVEPETEEDAEIRRVRVMIYLDGQEPQVAVQPQGGQAFIADDQMGEGAMPEMIEKSIKKALMMKVFEEMIEREGNK